MIKFIDQNDNRSANDATGITELSEVGSPAGTIREFFVRLGNVSGGTLSESITVEGEHADRLQVSFSDRGGYAYSLSLDGLQDGKSKNLYLRIEMPETVKSEDVTTYVVVGPDRLPVHYHATSAANSRFDPYPFYVGNFTESIWQMFEGKAVHRFIRFDPIEVDEVYSPINPPPGRFNINDGLMKLDSYLDPNNRNLGYEEPTIQDLTCIPTPRQFDSLERWTEEGTPYDWKDDGTVFLQPNFLNELGDSPPLWRFLSTDTGASGVDMYKRTQILMLRGWGQQVYHLENLHPVMVGQELAYYKADLLPLHEASGKNPWRYNPFAQVYLEDTDRVVNRYPCRAFPDLSVPLESDAT